MRDAEAAKLKPVRDHLIACGEAAADGKFTLTNAKEYLQRFRVENSKLCKGLPNLSLSNLEVAWYHLFYGLNSHKEKHIVLGEASVAPGIAECKRKACSYRGSCEGQTGEGEGPKSGDVGAEQRDHVHSC